MANVDIVKKAVADSFKELMRTKTIDKISVNEICEHSGLKRRNFYRYFEDKYEVAEWIYYHDYLLNAEHFENWSLWEYMPKLLEVIYEDQAFYLNAFQYVGQNSFRNCCLRYLREILRQDYLDCFESEAMYNFYFEHECNMAFDYFVLWLSSDPVLPPEEFLIHFRNLYYKPARKNCELLEREAPGRENSIPFTPIEPSKK